MSSRKNKGYKIKDYGRIFDGSERKRKKRTRNTIVFVVVIILLVFLGYSMAGPVKNLLNGEKTNVSSGQGTSSKPSEITSSSPALTETEKEFFEDEALISSAYLTREIAADETKLSAFLDNIKKLNYNSVVIELKDEAGTVYFATKNQMAASCSAVSATPIDTSALITKIKAAGLTPIAEIHAFKDKTATKNADAKIKYQGKEGWSWFDSANGKPWLNPYSDVAQGYITSLATELVDLGFENIMVSSVMFPQVSNFKYADFGAKEQTVSHSEILAQYTKTLKTALNDKGAALFLCYNAAEVSKENNVVYGGTDPSIAFSADVFVPTFALNADNGVELAKFVNDLKALKPQNRFVMKFAPTSIDGLAFSKEQIDAQKSVLVESGVYVYENSGNYIG